MDPREPVGFTTCTNCNGRFTVRAQHIPFEGRPIRCPRCHVEFNLVIQRPSIVEQAAIENREPTEPKSRKRRTKAQIRDEHLERVRTGFRSLHARLKNLADTSSSEEDIRVWCIDAIRDGLGWTSDDIDTELSTLGKRVDIALKHKGDVRVVIECKNTRTKLSDGVLAQAASYAMGLSAEWALITNGVGWKFYRVLPVAGQNPQVMPLFDIALLDEDGISDSDVDSLYLLTQRALLSGETEDAYHVMNCTSERRLLRALASDRVNKAIQRELTEVYTAELGRDPKISSELVGEQIRELFLPPDL
jgi:predicted Zn finger-like uncharacterized protein